MLRSLNTAVSGMQNSQDRIDVIGNNIANVNTTAFKGSRVDSADTFSQTLRAASTAGANTSAIGSMQIGTGVSNSAIKNIYTQGAMAKTDVPTDLAIDGEGYFVVRNTASGAEYATRAGEFRATNGFLTNNQGLRLQGYSNGALTNRGDIFIDTTGRPPSAATLLAEQTATTARAAADADPGNAALGTTADAAEAALATAQTADTNATVTSFKVGGDGKISVRLSDGTEFVRGQVLVQHFRDPQALEKEGNNLYSGFESAGALDSSVAPGTSGTGGIEAGYLELSNVDIANEFASLITSQRAFQANARIITTSDDIIQEVVNLKR